MASLRPLALLLVVLSGCGLTTISRDYLEEKDLELCLERYCHAYGDEDEPPVEECPYRDDVVVICVEEEGAKREAKQGWFARFLLAVAEAFP